MSRPPQIKIPATYMRGGTSKGVFFSLNDLPLAARQPGKVRDNLLLRVIGSPDPYGKQTDGMGGATSSTSKTVIVSASQRDDHDVDYLFGQVSINQPFVDWSGNCGNLSAAVAPFAIQQGLVKVPDNGIAEIRIWQANIEKTIIANVPITRGKVQETGDFELDGVTFPAAEIQLEFCDPAGDGALFPTGNLVDDIVVPEIGTLTATLINAGIPTIFLDAQTLGFSGTELQGAINNDAAMLSKLEKIRAYGAIKMGLIVHEQEAQQRQHTPKIAWVSKPQDYTASSGKPIAASSIDLLVRAMSMGQLHHAMMGTAAVAIGIAAAIPGTVVNAAAGGEHRLQFRFGHPSGTLKVGAEVRQEQSRWQARKAIMSRSARVLMSGHVHVPIAES